MSKQFLRILVSVNRFFSTINGFIFGISMQFSPIHSRKGRPYRIPLPVNVLLFAVLVVALVLFVRYAKHVTSVPVNSNVF